MKKRFLALTMALTLALGLLSGCQNTPGNTATPAPTPTPTAPTATPAAERTHVELAMLKGPTGMGAAKLISDAKAGATANDYALTLAAAPDELTGKLISGELDIAALPTNVAATLYHKTDGAIQMLALNTLGVLHILENGDTLKSLADLKGQTLYTTGRGANPEFVLDFLLTHVGLDPDSDLDIQWKTAEEVQALMISGEAKFAMLPVPAATAVLIQNQDVRDALDLTQVWQELEISGSLTMGCVVVRTAFAQEHPEAVAAFLEEYEASIRYVSDAPDDAAQLMVDAGIVPKLPIAKAAIPQANLVFVAKEDMLDSQAYYEVLFQADPASIGGSVPDDAFFYLS